MRKSALVGWTLLAPSLLLLGGLVAYPILYNFWLSLFAKHAFLPAQTFVGLGNYRYFATDEEFWRSVRYGTIYAGSTIVFQLGLGVAAALLLNETFRGRGLLRGVVLFPYTIPTVVAVILWKWLLNDSYGLVDYVLERFSLAGTPEACCRKIESLQAVGLENVCFNLSASPDLPAALRLYGERVLPAFAAETTG